MLALRRHRTRGESPLYKDQSVERRTHSTWDGTVRFLNTTQTLSRLPRVVLLVIGITNASSLFPLWTTKLLSVATQAYSRERKGAQQTSNRFYTQHP